MNARVLFPLIYTVITALLPLATSANAPKVTDSVVAVQTYTSESRIQRIGDYLGFVFEKDGFILTSYNALIHPEKQQLLTVIDVRPVNGDKTYPATIVGVEPTINLAILKIFADRELSAVSAADVTTMKTGEELRAVNLDSGQPTMIYGQLSGLNSRECYQESMTSTMFRAEISLQATDLGSPVFNLGNEVVAIYTGYQPPAEPGHIENPRELHLLPIQLALNIYDSLKYRQSMKSPWTGFSVIPLSAAQKTQFPTKAGDKGGIAIEHVWDNSPAQTLGIRPGDILTRFGHYRILSPADFQKWLYMYGVGHKVKLVLLREGKYIVHEYIIEERPQWAVPK